MHWPCLGKYIYKQANDFNLKSENYLVWGGVPDRELFNNPKTGCDLLVSKSIYRIARVNFVFSVCAVDSHYSQCNDKDNSSHLKTVTTVEVYITFVWDEKPKMRTLLEHPIGWRFCKKIFCRFLQNRLECAFSHCSVTEHTFLFSEYCFRQL